MKMRWIMLWLTVVLVVGCGEAVASPFDDNPGGGAANGDAGAGGNDGTGGDPGTGGVGGDDDDDDDGIDD